MLLIHLFLALGLFAPYLGLAGVAPARAKVELAAKEKLLVGFDVESLVKLLAFDAFGVPWLGRRRLAREYFQELLLFLLFFQELLVSNPLARYNLLRVLSGRGVVIAQVALEELQIVRSTAALALAIAWLE